MSGLVPDDWAAIEAPRIEVEPPGPRSRVILDRIEAGAYLGLSHGLHPLALAAKQGWTVTDVDGNVFLDLASASASVPLGAGREELLAPAIEAMRRFGNEDSHALISALTADLGERLLALAPASISRYDIALNGTEALEIAIKLMRRASGRSIVIGFHGSYHGESTLTAALGAEHNEISRGLRPLVSGFHHLPYPNPYRSPFRDPRPGGSGDATVDYLRDHILFHELDPNDVAGVVIEPVLGSGGCIAPPDSFWSALTALCKEHGWLLCVDEVKSGIGRAGKLFAGDRWGLEPDLICLGKALGGGVMPIGALLGSERALGGFDDVPTGSTWAWLPGACAAALATLDFFEREPVLENVAALERVAGERLGATRRRTRADRRGPRCRLLPRDRVRPRPRDQGTRPGTSGRGRRRGASPRRDRRLEHDLAEPAAVAGLMPPAELARALAIVADAVATVIGARSR